MCRLSSHFLPYDESKCYFPLVFHDAACYPHYKGLEGCGGRVSFLLSYYVNVRHQSEPVSITCYHSSLSGFEPLGEVSLDTTWWLTDEPADICLSGRPEFGWIMECSCNICLLTEESPGNPSTCPVGYLHPNST